MEESPELGEGHNTTFYRELDARIGRWWSVAPKAELYYSWSPYNLSADNPIANSDPSGATVVFSSPREEEMYNYFKQMCYETGKTDQIAKLQKLEASDIIYRITLDRKVESGGYFRFFNYDAETSTYTMELAIPGLIGRKNGLTGIS